MFQQLCLPSSTDYPVYHIHNGLEQYNGTICQQQQKKYPQPNPNDKHVALELIYFKYNKSWKLFTEKRIWYQEEEATQNSLVYRKKVVL
jgi:hypothetical protein